MKWVKEESNHEPCNETAKTWNITIKFHLYYFVVGFTCSMLSFFPKVICSMKYSSAQCSPNVVRVMVGFSNLSKFFDLDLTIDELYMSQSLGFIEPNLLSLCVNCIKQFMDSSKPNVSIHFLYNLILSRVLLITLCLPFIKVLIFILDVDDIVLAGNSPSLTQSFIRT